MRYGKPEAGEDVFPVMDGYKFACCDCGLVHRIDFQAVRVTKTNSDGSWKGKALDKAKYRVAMQVYRDNRATAAMRRERKKRG